MKQAGRWRVVVALRLWAAMWWRMVFRINGIRIGAIAAERQERRNECGFEIRCFA